MSGEPWQVVGLPPFNVVAGVKEVIPHCPVLLLGVREVSVLSVVLRDVCVISRSPGSFCNASKAWRRALQP